MASNDRNGVKNESKFVHEGAFRSASAAKLVLYKFFTPNNAQSTAIVGYTAASTSRVFASALMLSEYNVGPMKDGVKNVSSC